MAFDPEVREDIDALIAEAAKQIALVEGSYEGALHARHASGTLRVQIKNVLENQRSALEYLANGLHEALGGTPSGRVFFPIAPAPKDFPALIKGQLPTVTKDVAAYGVIEAAQPYQTGCAWIGHLAVLTRQNKHHRLTPQVRDETRQVEVRTPGGGGVTYTPYQEGKGGVIFGGQFGQVLINGVPVDPRTQRPVPSQTQTVTERVWVDWQFDEPRVSVLATVREIQEKLPALIHDVLSASGL